jgi:acetolactate synthase-like protein
LGIGGGFALGAKLCFPEADVFILYGDGSSAYSLMEFDTFKRHGLPVIAIIGNDASWSQIARDQIEILKDDCGTVLASSNYERVAEAFGGKGKRVNTIEEFNQALSEAQESVKQGVPFVINAVLAKSAFRKGSLSM